MFERKAVYAIFLLSMLYFEVDMRNLRLRLWDGSGRRVLVRIVFAVLMVLVLVGITAGCSDMLQTGDSIVVYSGRNRSLVEPLIREFEAESGIRVRVKYGTTPQLAMTLREEGARSPADVFWAQETSALETLHADGFFASLPADIIEDSAPSLRYGKEHWVATSGRARVLAYNTDAVPSAELPSTVLGLTQDNWRGRIGWAPTNGSFQVFLTGMRLVFGEDVTREWVEAIRDNDAMAYPNNTAILQALGDGEIDVGLTNHYYLLRFKDDDPDFPVDQTAFDDGDPGNFVNYAGIGLLQSSDQPEKAQQFIRFLLSEAAQQYFTQEVFEYPVNDRAQRHDALDPLEDLLQRAPDVDLNAMDDLEGTLKLLRDAGLL